MGKTQEQKKIYIFLAVIISLLLVIKFNSITGYLPHGPPGGGPAQEGVFIESLEWETGLTYSSGPISLTDIDNDDKLDLLIIGRNFSNAYRAYIYINNGTNLVENSTWVSNITSTMYGSIDWADIDNDDDLDLFITGDDGSNPRTLVYINNGTHLQENTTWEANLTPVQRASLTFGDIDNDGDLDIALAGEDDAENMYIEIYTNNGSSLVRNNTWETNLTDLLYGSVEFGDLDNDGDLDLILTGTDNVEVEVSSNDQVFEPFFPDPEPDTYIYGYTYVYINNGTSFVENSTWQANLEGVYNGEIAFGDVDEDDDLDVIISGIAYRPTGGNSVSFCGLYINNDTTFLDDATLAFGSNGGVTGTQTFGDLDIDGDLDMVSSGNSLSGAIGGYTDRIYVYINDGSSFVSNSTWKDNITRTDGQNVLGDIDNDGDLDLILIDRIYYRRVFVYINSVSVPNEAPESPSSLSNSYSNNILNLTWGDGSDNETYSNGLYYNLRLGTTSGGNDIVSGVYGGEDVNGYFGNMMQRNSIDLTVPNQTYYWSVQTIDSGLENSSWSTEQTYPDTTNPIITLISPADSSSWTTSSLVTFSYTASDISGIKNCSLIVNDTVDQTDTSITVNATQTFTKPFSNQYYNWYINCIDSNDLSVNSETRALTVNYNIESSSQGGSSVGQSLISIPEKTEVDLCTDVECSISSLICADGYEATCNEVCIPATGNCGTCTPDCTGHGIECLVCEEETEWTDCKDNKQFRTIWNCDKETNYKCISEIETKECLIEVTPIPTLSPVIIFILIIIGWLLMPRLKFLKKKN